MTLRRLTLFIVGLCATVLTGAPAVAQSGGSVTTQTNVQVLKPLQLTTLRNMDFGTVVLGNLTTNQTISVTSAGRNCGSSAQLTCTGTFATAQFQVIGSNNQVVSIRAATPTTTLTSASGARLTLTPIVPGSVTMPNSGNQGVTFEVGGSLVITPGSPDGLYSGIVDIQVSYQ